MASDSDLDEARQLGLCHYLLTFARMHPVGDGRSHLVPVRLAMKVLTDMGLAPSVKEAGQLLSHPSLRERISLVQLESGDQGAATLYYKIEPLVEPAGYPRPLLTAQQLKSFSTSFISCYPLEVARQLSLIEHELFTSLVPAVDLVNLADTTKTKAVADWVCWSNRLSDWVVTEVLQQANTDERCLVYKRFSHVAEECKKLHNFSSMSSIALALGAPTISWLASLVDTKTIKRQKDLENLCSPMNNFATLREAMGRISDDEPVVPYLPVFLKDLTLIELGNEDQHHRLELAAPIFERLEQLKQRRYLLVPIFTLQRWLRVGVVILSEEERTFLSQRLRKDFEEKRLRSPPQMPIAQARLVRGSLRDRTRSVSTDSLLALIKGVRNKKDDDENPAASDEEAAELLERLRAAQQQSLKHQQTLERQAEMAAASPSPPLPPCETDQRPPHIDMVPLSPLPPPAKRPSNKLNSPAHFEPLSDKPSPYDILEQLVSESSLQSSNTDNTSPGRLALTPSDDSDEVLSFLLTNEPESR